MVAKALGEQEAQLQYAPNRLSAGALPQTHWGAYSASQIP